MKTLISHPLLIKKHTISWLFPLFAKVSLFHPHITISTFRLCQRAWKHILCANGCRKFLINIKFCPSEKKKKNNLNATERWEKNFPFCVPGAKWQVRLNFPSKFSKRDYISGVRMSSTMSVCVFRWKIWWVLSDMMITSSWFSIIHFLCIIVTHQHYFRAS